MPGVTRALPQATLATSSDQRQAADSLDSEFGEAIFTAGLGAHESTANLGTEPGNGVSETSEIPSPRQRMKQTGEGTVWKGWKGGWMTCSREGTKNYARERERKKESQRDKQRNKT